MFTTMISQYRMSRNTCVPGERPRTQLCGSNNIEEAAARSMWALLQKLHLKPTSLKEWCFRDEIEVEMFF